MDLLSRVVNSTDGTNYNMTVLELMKDKGYHYEFIYSGCLPECWFTQWHLVFNDIFSFLAWKDTFSPKPLYGLLHVRKTGLMAFGEITVPWLGLIWNDQYSSSVYFELTYPQHLLTCNKL